MLITLSKRVRAELLYEPTRTWAQKGVSTKTAEVEFAALVLAGHVPVALALAKHDFTIFVSNNSLQRVQRPFEPTRGRQVRRQRR